MHLRLQPGAAGVQSRRLHSLHAGRRLNCETRSIAATAINLILQNFVQKYGPTVLAAPPQSGFNLVAWIAPGLVFLLAMMGTALVIRKWKLQHGFHAGGKG